MIDIVAKRRWFYLVSLVLIIPGVVSLLLPGGIRTSIDFSSGTIMTLRFANAVEPQHVRDAFGAAGHPEVIVQRTGEGDYLVRARPFDQIGTESLIDGSQQSERELVMESVAEKLGPLDVLVFDFVSPLIAAEIVRHSMLAVAAACVGILLYLSWAFRRMPHPWRYGVCAVTALVHDVLLVVGAFSLLGRVLPIEIDAMFITAILTSIGFSVHDTIVVFDRLRENSLRLPDEPFDSVVNHSLMQTLVRSIGTSITTLLVLFALFLFGGTTIRPFVLALLIGITAGTYSSIFNASLLLVSWEKGESWRSLIPRRA